MQAGVSISYEIAGCPVCGGRGAELLADEEDIRDEIEALWQHHTAGDVPIPIPELADRLAFTHPPPLAVVRCMACGLLYRNPRERFVRELYETETLDSGQLQALCDVQRPTFEPALARLTALNAGVGRGLEVGSYAGAFLQAAAASAWRFTGLDVNPAVVAFLRQQGYEVSLGGIEQAPDGVRECDVVAIWNCFDQLPDPLAAAAAAHERLRAGGILALRVPNGDFYASLRAHLYGALSRPAAALLARHNFLGFPYRYGFTPESISRLLERAGFQVLDVRSAEVLPVPGTNGDAAAALLNAAELAIRPLAGAPWLELYARRS